METFDYVNDPLTAGQVETLKALLGDQWCSEARDGFLVISGRFIDEMGTDRTGELAAVFRTDLEAGRIALREGLLALLHFVGDLSKFERDYPVLINDPVAGSTPVFPQLPIPGIRNLAPCLYRVLDSRAMVHGSEERTRDYIMRVGRLPYVERITELVRRSKPRIHWCSYERYETPAATRSALQILDEWGSDCRLRATLPTSARDLEVYVAFSGVMEYPADVINLSGNHAFAGYNVEMVATDHPDLPGGGLQVGAVGSPAVSALELWDDEQGAWQSLWTAGTPVR